MLKSRPVPIKVATLAASISLALTLVANTQSAHAQIPADLSLEQVTTIGTRAVAVRNAGDGSNRLFIPQQSGIIWIYDIDSDTLLNTPFLDIQSLVDDGGNEQGLLGLAFDPNYSSNGFFYVNYTRDPGPGLDRTIIERYTVSKDANVANPSSNVTVLEIAQDFSNHNGGDIHFGPDGYLYIGMGDGGSGGDPNGRAQDPDQLLGKMLRIDVSGTVGDFKLQESRQNLGVINECGLVTNYSIPADNPYINDDNTCDEIWAFGLRNPWRFSFDRVTGDLFIGDVGQNAMEEVNFQPGESTGGENYGWDCREGTIPHESCQNPPPFVEPIIAYNQGPGFSVAGGFVYRGSISSMVGTYFYADIFSNQIFYATEAGSWNPTLWGTTVPTPYSFGEDDAGELYISTASGAIYRFTSSEAGGSIFADGFESGDTSAW